MELKLALHAAGFLAQYQVLESHKVNAAGFEALLHHCCCCAKPST